MKFDGSVVIWGHKQCGGGMQYNAAVNAQIRQSIARKADWQVSAPCLSIASSSSQASPISPPTAGLSQSPERQSGFGCWAKQENDELQMLEIRLNELLAESFDGARFEPRGEDWFRWPEAITKVLEVWRTSIKDLTHRLAALEESISHAITSEDLSDQLAALEESMTRGIALEAGRLAALEDSVRKHDGLASGMEHHFVRLSDLENKLWEHTTQVPNMAHHHERLSLMENTVGQYSEGLTNINDMCSRLEALEEAHKRHVAEMAQRHEQQLAEFFGSVRETAERGPQDSTELEERLSPLEELGSMHAALATDLRQHHDRLSLLEDSISESKGRPAQFTELLEQFSMLEDRFKEHVEHTASIRQHERDVLTDDKSQYHMRLSTLEDRLSELSEHVTDKSRPQELVNGQAEYTTEGFKRMIDEVQERVLCQVGQQFSTLQRSTEELLSERVKELEGILEQKLLVGRADEDAWVDSQQERLRKLEVDIEQLRAHQQDELREGQGSLSSGLQLQERSLTGPEEKLPVLPLQLDAPPTGVHERLCRVEEHLGGIAILDDRVCELQDLVQQLMEPGQLQAIAEERQGYMMDGQQFPHVEGSGDQEEVLAVGPAAQIRTAGQGALAKDVGLTEERVFKLEQAVQQLAAGGQVELAGSISNTEERLLRLEHGFEQLAVEMETQATATRHEMGTVCSSISMVSSRLEEALMTLAIEPNREEDVSIGYAGFASQADLQT